MPCVTFQFHIFHIHVWYHYSITYLLIIVPYYSHYVIITTVHCASAIVTLRMINCNIREEYNPNGEEWRLLGSIERILCSVRGVLVVDWIKK